MIWNDEFDLVYDDWMIMDNVELEKSYAAKELFQCVIKKYGDTSETKEKVDYLYEKALVLNQKLSMMLYAKYNIFKVKSDFESTQNMEIPALYGIGKTRILFYLESMIVFARNALDVAATVYSDLLLDKRLDSFNDFSKKIMKSTDTQLQSLKEYFLKNSDDGLCAYRLLCGSEKGRALKDIIIHQANVNLIYSEYRENSEKERLFLILKNEPLVDLDDFVHSFISEVEEIFSLTTRLCEQYIINNSSFTRKKAD